MARSTYDNICGDNFKGLLGKIIISPFLQHDRLYVREPEPLIDHAMPLFDPPTFNPYKMYVPLQEEPQMHNSTPNNFPLMQQLSICIAKDAADAVAQGHVYHEGYIPVKLDHVVLVKDGTVEHNPTVDFVMEDASGAKYVFMITGALIEMLTTAIKSR
jgi:hypothetical protein